MENDIKIGDTIICINNGQIDNMNGKTPPLKLNGEYICQDIKTCPCGFKSYDVGISSMSDVHRCSCGRGVTNEPIWWCAAIRFIKKKSLEEQMEEALKNEDYETLHKLTNK